MKRFISSRAALLLALYLLLGAAPRLSAETLFEASLALLPERAAQADPRDYSFVVLGDSRDNDNVFGRILGLAKSFNPVFILHGGDIVHSGTREEFKHFRDFMSQNLSGIPFFVSIGNHELTQKKDKQLFQEYIGPLDFSLDLPGLDLSLVALDNSQESLSSGQLSYLESKLTSGRGLKFTLMHVPPRTPRWPGHSMSQFPDELYAILSQAKVTAAFYGHIHVFDQDLLSGVPSIVTGGAGAPLYRSGSGDASYHILVVRVKDGQAKWREVRLEE